MPQAYWVHADDRLGHGSDVTPPSEQAEQAVVDSLRESSFMMITEDLGAKATSPCWDQQPASADDSAFLAGNAEGREGVATGWEQVGAMGIRRAKLVLSSAARLHATCWRQSQAGNNGNNPMFEQHTEQHSREHEAIGLPDAEAAATAAGREAEGMAAPIASFEERERERPNTRLLHGSSSFYRYAPGLHDQGTFSSLEKRDPGDLPGLESEYEKLLARFRSLLPAA